MVHAVRDEVDEAFEWLERSFAQRDSGLAFLRGHHQLEPLHGDPRWQAMLKKMRFPDVVAAGRAGLEHHVMTAGARQPSLAARQVSPHVLRHTCAMHTLQATQGARKVALWLGHASVQATEIDLRAESPSRPMRL